MYALRPTGRTIDSLAPWADCCSAMTQALSRERCYSSDDFKVSPFLQGAIVAGLLLGAMIGAASADGGLADHLGRRRLIITAAVVFTAGSCASRVRAHRLGAHCGPLRDWPGRWIGCPGGAALSVGDSPHRSARCDRLAQPANDRLRHPRGIHRQRDPGLFGQLAPDAGAGRCPVAGPAGGDAVHAGNAPLPRPRRARGNCARRPGGPPRRSAAARADRGDPKRSTTRRRGTPDLWRRGTRNGCAQRYWWRPG